MCLTNPLYELIPCGAVGGGGDHGKGLLITVSPWATRLTVALLGHLSHLRERSYWTGLGVAGSIGTEVSCGTPVISSEGDIMGHVDL